MAGEWAGRHGMGSKAAGVQGLREEIQVPSCPMKDRDTPLTKQSNDYYGLGPRRAWLVWLGPACSPFQTNKKKGDIARSALPCSEAVSRSQVSCKRDL